MLAPLRAAPLRAPSCLRLACCRPTGMRNHHLGPQNHHFGVQNRHFGPHFEVPHDRSGSVRLLLAPAEAHLGLVTQLLAAADLARSDLQHGQNDHFGVQNHHFGPHFGVRHAAYGLVRLLLAAAEAHLGLLRSC